MKKFKKLLIITFAFLSLLTLTGCEKKFSKSKLTPQEALTKSQEISNTAQNYKLDMKMDLGFAAEVQGISMSLDIDVNASAKIDIKNKSAYMLINTKSEENEHKQEMYIIYDEANNKVTTYTSNGEGWNKVVLDSEASSVQNYGSDMTEVLLNNSKIEQLDPDKDNYNYEILLNKNDLVKLLAFGDMTESMDNVLSNVSGDVKLTISLNKKDYSLSKIKIDLLDVLKSQKVPGITYTKAGYEISFSEYGKVENIKVPEDVIKNAKEVTEKELLDNDFESLE